MFGHQCLEKVRVRGRDTVQEGKRGAQRGSLLVPSGAGCWRCWACGRHTGVCLIAAGFGVVGTHCVWGPVGWDPCGVGACVAGLWWHTGVRRPTGGYGIAPL